MLQILIGSLVLSIIHASIPNHWIPLVVIGKAEKWPLNETLRVSAITASVHTLSTILIGILVGLLGYRLSSAHELIARVAAPLILVILGFIYLILDLRDSHNHHDPAEISSIPKKSKLTIITSLSIAMFFSPCIEIEAYYFTAGTLGWPGIITVSVIYLFVTVLGVLFLVSFGGKGLEKIRWHFLEYHEKRVIGVVLIVLGIFAYFIKI